MQKGWASGITVASIATLILLSSCASTPKKENSSASGDSYVPDTSQAVSIPVPKKTSRSYFSSINKNILDFAETGSPETLRLAASMLHKVNAEDYEENEKVLLAVCAEVMEIAWPSQKAGWDVPEVTVSTPYLGAIDSAKRGIYDSSTGNTDFLTLVLPSLVLLTSSTRSDYYVESNAALSAALEMKPDSVLANYLMGMLKVKVNHADESLPYFAEAVDLSPDCIEVLYAQANAYHITGNNTVALAIGEKQLAMYPQNVQLLELCAQTAYSLGDRDKAEQYVVRVLQVEPENSKYVLFRSRILMDKGDYIKASSLLDMYARTDNTSKEYLLLRARLQRDWNKNMTAAGATMEQALTLYPNDFSVLLFSAQLASMANIKIGEYTALSLANLVLAINSTNTDAQVLSMTELAKSGEWEKAYEISSELIAKKDCPQSILFTHVDICLALNKREEANKIASTLYSNAPNDENAQQLYLKVLVAFGRKTEGLKLIERLLPTASTRMKSFLLYERSFYEPDEETLLSDLRSSLTANPRNKDALYRLYEIYYKKKDWRKAQYYLKQVVALNPTDASLLKLNAELETHLNK